MSGREKEGNEGWICVVTMLVVHRAMDCDQKNIEASAAVPPAPVRVPSQWPFTPRQSRLSANDKDVNDAFPSPKYITVYKTVSD